MIRVETEASARPDALVHAPLRRIEPGPLAAWGYEPALWDMPGRLTLLVLASQLFAEQQARIRFFHTVLSQGRAAEPRIRLRRADGSVVEVDAEAAIVQEGAAYVLRVELRERDVDAAPARAAGDATPPATPGGVTGAVRTRLFDQLAVPELGRTAEQLSRFLAWVAGRRAPLLIVGEPGTGASFLAEAIHESRRPDGRLERLDADLESRTATHRELERHLGGASGADGLLVLRSDLVDPDLVERFLTATLADPPPILAYATARPGARVVSRFDEAGADVFTLLPLRERRQDVLPVVSRILRRPRPGLRVFQSIHPLAARALQEHDWPGNMTELKESAEAARLISGGSELRLEDLPVAVTATLSHGRRSEMPVLAPSAHGRRGRPPKDLSVGQIRDALAETSGNRARAARLLGVSRTTLWRKMAEMGAEIFDEDVPGSGDAGRAAEGDAPDESS